MAAWSWSRSKPGTPIYCIPISIAARDASLDTIELLLERGADLLNFTETGLTPVQYALENGSEEAASILAEGERQSNVRQGEI